MHNNNINSICFIFLKIDNNNKRLSVQWKQNKHYKDVHKISNINISYYEV